MIIYQVYVGSTAKSEFFKTKKGAQKYVKDFYEEYVAVEGEDTAVTLDEFILEEGIEILKISVSP